MATFYNQATLSYQDTTVNSNIVTGELVQVLSASKQVVDGSYQAGQTLTYAVNIVNAGTTPFTGLTVTDDLGSYALSDGTNVTPLTYAADSVQYYVNGALQKNPTVSPTSPLTITGITVPANGNALLLYQATVNEYAPLASGSTIENTARITGSGFSETVEATDTVPVNGTPILSISKAICPSSVAENGTVTYTFVMENRGNTAADGAVLSDTFDPILTDLTVTYNGTAWTEGTQYAYSDNTGVFTTEANQITIPAATITQDAATGISTIVPGTAMIVVTGTI